MPESELEHALNAPRRIALKAVQDVVLFMANNRGKIKGNPEMTKELFRLKGDMDEKVSSLNSCDALYVTDEYAKWFKEEIEPRFKDEIEQIRKMEL
jgi:hypothetical protein